MSENLRDEMQRALKETWRDRAMSVSFDVTWRAMTDAAWEVVGPELDRLRAEVERLKRQERGQTTAAMTAWRAADVSRERVKAVEAECDVLRARLAKVEALAREVADGGVLLHPTVLHPEVCAACEVARKVLALASVPEPSDSVPHAPCCDACGGSGASDGASSNGLCWDCRGTGCAHEPSEPAPDAEREAGERRWLSSGHSWCSGCNLSIKPGDEVTYDAKDRVVHLADLEDGAS